MNKSLLYILAGLFTFIIIVQGLTAFIAFIVSNLWLFLPLPFIVYYVFRR